MKRFAGQIIEDCELDDMAAIRDLAQAIRENSDLDERARYAETIIAEVDAILAARDAEAAPVALAM
ncbi:MAG: hypothetical protein MOB07_26150 [Acidobacteria bacterium]|nr:hypothetical protein [Acidobacteriota bacterium]